MGHKTRETVRTDYLADTAEERLAKSTRGRRFHQVQIEETTNFIVSWPTRASANIYAFTSRSTRALLSGARWSPTHPQALHNHQLEAFVPGFKHGYRKRRETDTPCSGLHDRPGWRVCQFVKRAVSDYIVLTGNCCAEGVSTAERQFSTSCCSPRCVSSRLPGMTT